MAEIRSYGFIRHLRGEASSHLALSRDGTVLRSGRGLSFWFFPLSSSVWEVPVDDRELPLLFRGRSADFQDITTQGLVAWRVTSPQQLASRVDFTLDLATGAWTREPLEQVGQLLTQLAQQVAWAYLAHHRLEEVLQDGVEQLRARIAEALADDPTVQQLGIEVVGVRVASVRPTAEMEKALQMPTRERIQQEADKATYERRALAVERERAIAENELNNQIELARRTEELIAREGANERRRIEEKAAASRLEATAKAERSRIHAQSQAESMRLVEAAKAEAERETMDIYREVPQSLLLGLAARELAGNLPAVEHLTLSPELIGPALSRLADKVGGV